MHNQQSLPANLQGQFAQATKSSCNLQGQFAQATKSSCNLQGQFAQPTKSSCNLQGQFAQPTKSSCKLAGTVCTSYKVFLRTCRSSLHKLQSLLANLQEQFAQTTKTFCKSTRAWIFLYFLLVIAGLTRNPPFTEYEQKEETSLLIENLH
ncbi:MAG: hypothetical protein ACRC3G_05375 [Bacteroidales bacterium]